MTLEVTLDLEEVHKLISDALKLKYPQDFTHGAKVRWKGNQAIAVPLTNE